MRLAAVLGTLSDRLGDQLDGVAVGDAVPAAASDLPAVTLAVSDVAERLAGIGRLARGSRTGALPVEQTVDLADPVLIAPGETVALLSPDRRTLTLPNGPLVRADGVAEPPYAAADLQVTDGGPWQTVTGDPGPGEVRPDPDLGVLVFGEPLPAAGTLEVRYHVGRWDVTVLRYQGRLGLTLTAGTAQAVRMLTGRVEAALSEPRPDVRLSPVAWASSAPTTVGGDDAHARDLSYRFDAEIEEPLLPSGGGVITRVAVGVHVGGASESFAVAREGSPA